MKCVVLSCNNEAVLCATQIDNGKEFKICKPCSEREDRYEVLGEVYYQKTWQVGMKLRPLEIVAQ